MTIWDYPVTTPYGQVAGYPLNNGFHKGIDYGAPMGTAVTVNGVTIGLSGNTGASTGPHCHVGRWVGGLPTNPGVQGGKKISNATVSEIGEDAVNGKYVRIADADGSSWVFLHLSQINVTKGQKLQGGNMSTIATQEIVDSLAHAYLNDSVANNPGLRFYIGQPVETVINVFNNAPQRATYLQSQADKDVAITDLKAQLKAAKGASVINQDAINQIAETNSIVKQIWSKITSIFK